jgi:cysteinyl-tRNA synthetase
MKIFNSYTNKLETFVPHHPNRISMYVCGPTVYNYIHIGNARPVVVFDTVRRYFEYKGYNVQFVSNFTDVDDKIIQAAKEANVPEMIISEKYIKAFLEDVVALNCKTDYLKPKVTEYIPQIIAYIQSLIELGYAYIIEGDVYFRVSKLAEYGKLSNRKLDDLIAGSRVEINEKKESPLDFTLWKKTEEGLHWHTSFSDGRPGWHTECVAMIDDIFGEEIDIHGGGTDLMFPHHENEIAQSLAKNHHHVARYWMHNGRLNLEGEKMSKSLGNDIKVKDLNIDLKAYRMFLLSTHYRSPLNFSIEALDVFVREWAKITKTVESLHRTLDLHDSLESNVIVTAGDIMEVIDYFLTSMDNDFNTPNALTALNQLMRSINQKMRQKLDYAWLNQALRAINDMLSVLGLEVPLIRLADEDRVLINQWEQARVDKDFALADMLRKKISEKGLL